MVYLGENNQGSVRSSQLTKETIQTVVSQIADELVVKGVYALIDEEYDFPAFIRAIQELAQAKTEKNLLVVEAGLQTTINQIIQYSKTSPKYWNNGKTSLYLYTLQNIILRLNQFKLLNTQGNKYKPQIIESVHMVSEKCAKLGINMNVMRSQCLTSKYKYPNNDKLRNFEFIDINLVTAFDKKLSDLLAHKQHNLITKTYHTYDVNVGLQKFVEHMENMFNIKHLDLATYEENCGPIINELNKLLTRSNARKEEIPLVIDALKNYIKNRDKTTNDDHTM